MTDKTNSGIYTATDLFMAACTYTTTMHAISRAFMAESTLIAMKSSQRAVDTFVSAVTAAASVDLSNQSKKP